MMTIEDARKQIAEVWGVPEEDIRLEVETEPSGDGYPPNVSVICPLVEISIVWTAGNILDESDQSRLLTALVAAARAVANIYP